MARSEIYVPEARSGWWGRFARSQLLQKGDASNVVKQGLLQWSYAPLTILHGM